eukprot:9931596-Alexandrium_andersonii.AAC.1
MSASLVGSEMCIRDRCTDNNTSSSFQYLFPTLSSSFLRLPQGLSPPPVSYTHLTLPTICSV